MKTYFVRTSFFLILLTLPAFGLEVENKKVGGGDQNEGATYSFIRAGAKRFMLPFRTAVVNFVHNADKSLWAINYHETSDYDSVDLVIERGDDVFVVPDMWSLILDDVQAAKIVDGQLERVHFQVLGVNGEHLSCRLIGRRGTRSIDHSFSLAVRVVNQRPTFDIIK